MKINRLLASVFALLLLAGCNSNSSSGAETSSGSSQASQASTASISSSSSQDEEPGITDASLKYLEQFQAGDFSAFYQNTTEQFSTQVPQEMLSLQWSAVIQMAGAQEAILNTEATPEQQGISSVTITARHVLRNVAATFSYDTEGKIAGLFLSFQPLEVTPESTDAWEEHAIQVGSGEKKLNGMLTLPKGVEQPPVIILVQGSGPSNMDEKIGAGGNKPFADIAHGLAEKGIASIRYDKRTYAYPEESSGNIGIEDEYLKDVTAAVSLAAADGRVDKDRIYLLGHSEGGMLAPKFALDNPEIKGFVSLAGSLRKLEDIMLEQVQKSITSNPDLTQEQKDAYLQQYDAEVQKIKALSPDDTSSVILGAPAVYWNSLSAIDSKAIAQGLDIPMLILQGGEDFQVLADVDYPLWQEALAGKANVSYQLYPELNHMFMRGGSKDIIDVTVYDTPAQVEPSVIADIADWIAGLA